MTSDCITREELWNMKKWVDGELSRSKNARFKSLPKLEKDVRFLKGKTERLSSELDSLKLELNFVKTSKNNFTSDYSFFVGMGLGAMFVTGFIFGAWVFF